MIETMHFLTLLIEFFLQVIISDIFCISFFSSEQLKARINDISDECGSGSYAFFRID